MRRLFLFWPEAKTKGIILYRGETLADMENPFNNTATLLDVFSLRSNWYPFALPSGQGKLIL